MGVVVVDKSGTGNPAIEALVVEATVVRRRWRLRKSSTRKKKTWRLNASVL
jgi:hypothetical protein